MEDTELFIQGLREGFRTKMANTIDDYEVQIVGLRVQLTKADEREQHLVARVESLQNQITEMSKESNAGTQEAAESGDAASEDSDDAN
jgi:hypothetical protein